jgi:Tfp pilus assembly protein PilF
MWAYPHSCLALILDNPEKFDRAAIELQRAIQLDPKASYLHNDMGGFSTRAV